MIKFNELLNRNKMQRQVRFEITPLTKREASIRELHSVTIGDKQVVFYVTTERDRDTYRIVPNAIATLSSEDSEGSLEDVINEVLNPTTVAGQFLLKPGIIQYKGYRLNIFIGADNQYHAEVV